MIGENKIKKSEDGDIKEIEKLCLTTWEHLYRYIYFKVQNREEAEDITQETYVKTIAYLKRDRINPDKYIGFLKTVAVNLLRDKWRKKKRQGVNVNFDEVNLADTVSSNYTETSIQRQLIEDALKGLGEEQQNVINLRIIKGYSVAETAKIMGKSEGAVRSMQFRAVQNLAMILNVD